MSLSLLSLSESPELLSSIIAYLTPTDTFSLLLTCQTLYPIAHQCLWSSLNLSEYDSSVPSSYRRENHVIGKRGRYKLAQLFNIYGSDVSGLRYIQNLSLKGGVFARSSIVRSSGLLGLLGEQIYRRTMELRHVSLQISSKDLEDPFASKEVLIFLQTLKTYAKSKSPGDFSLHIISDFISPTLSRDKFKHSLSDLLDLTKAVKISLTLTLRNRILTTDEQEAIWESDEDEDFMDTDNGNRSPPHRLRDYDVVGDSDTGNIREQAKALSALLFGSPNLRHLQLATNTTRYEPVEIYNFVKALRALQRTLLGLRKLKIMELDGLIFHPCFFLQPPESVKVFRISSGGTSNVSAAWWKKFAACPFTNVEDMILDTQHMNLGSWTSGDDEEEQQGSSEFKFWMFGVGDVKAENLRTFRAPLLEMLQVNHGPVDLLECVLRKNRGLDEDSVRRLGEACALDQAYKREAMSLMRSRGHVYHGNGVW